MLNDLKILLQMNSNLELTTQNLRGLKHSLTKFKTLHSSLDVNSEKKQFFTSKVSAQSNQKDGKKTRPNDKEPQQRRFIEKNKNKKKKTGSEKPQFSQNAGNIMTEVLSKMPSDGKPPLIEILTKNDIAHNYSAASCLHYNTV